MEVHDGLRFLQLKRSNFDLQECQAESARIRWFWDFSAANLQAKLRSGIADQSPIEIRNGEAAQQPSERRKQALVQAKLRVALAGNEKTEKRL